MDEGSSLPLPPFERKPIAPEPPKPLVAQVGDQIIVFPEEWPRCVAANSRGRRCTGGLRGQANYWGWFSYYVPELGGKVSALQTNDQESLILQRCPKHVDEDAKTLLAPEWVYFNPSEHAGLVRPHRRNIWTPNGVKVVIESSTTSFTEPSAPNDELAELLVKAAQLRAAPPAVTTALYRYYDTHDQLLYVGITDNLIVRTLDHVQGSSWAEFATRATIERHPTRKEAEDAERAAIKAERPLFNSQHQDTPEARRRLVEYLIEQGRTDLLVANVSRG